MDKEIFSQRIGILIPTYNSEKTIQQTLMSLVTCDQVDSVSLLIIGDDGSVDQTLRLVGEMPVTKFKVCVFSWGTNVGERWNLNRTIQLVRDDLDWILIVHSDDLVKSNWIVEMCQRIERCAPTVASISSSWDTLNEDGQMVAGENGRGVNHIKGGLKAARRALRIGGWWHISGCAIRLSAFDDIGDFNPRMPQLGDVEWITRCLLGGWDVEYIPRSLVIYRQHRCSVSANSLKIDRDILEYLNMIVSFQSVLSFADKANIYLNQGTICVRRIARALSQREFLIAMRRLYLLRKIFIQWFRYGLYKELHNDGQ